MSLLLQPLDRVDRYVEEQAARRTLWGFQHIPKTAGSSLVELLKTLLPPYYNIEPKTYFASGPEFRRLRSLATLEFIDLQTKRPEADKFRSFSGHLFRRELDTIRAAFPEARVFTLLRDPAARVISDYRYCLTQAHPTHTEFAQKYLSLADFVNDHRNQNTMAKMLAPPSPFLHGEHLPRARPEQVIEAVLPYYEFIGTYERYNESAEIAMTLMGIKKAPAPPRVNVTDDIPRNRVEVEASMIEAIRAANAIDAGLYDAVDRHLDGVIQALRSYKRSPPRDRTVSMTTPSETEPPGDVLFILGAPRSGTTQMIRLCRDVLGYGGASEGHVWQSVKALDDHFRRVEFDIGEMVSAERQSSLHRLTRPTMVTKYTEFVLALHRATYGEGPIVDKPLGVEAISATPLIRHAMPQARFIFMRRRGIENVVSQLRRFPYLTFEAACASWANTMAAWRETRSSLGEDALEIDQRDLCLNAQEVARRLTAFLGRGDADAIADYLPKHFPEKTSAGDYSGCLSFRATAWSDAQRQIFVDRCADMMAAFGYAMEGNVQNSPGKVRDLAAPPQVSHWTIENSNAWTTVGVMGIRLHPNPPGQPPPILRLPSALSPGEYDLDAEVVIFQERCQPLRFELDFEDGIERRKLACAVDGSKLGRLRWTEENVTIARTANVELRVVLDENAPNSNYSATQIVRMAFQRK